MAEKLTRPLLLAGCGKMGGAMLSGWLESGITGGGVTIVDPFGGKAFEGSPGVSRVEDPEALPEGLDPEVIVLAVKPQQMDAMLATYSRYASPNCLFLSIAAGKTIGYFEEHLGGNAAIVRAMPNTPAAIGQGITVICPNAHCSGAQVEIAEALLRSVGEVYSVENEDAIDAVTGLSGGGPAYVFWLIECMAEAGIRAGLEPDLSRRLALVTVAGAGQLAIHGDDDPTQLRKNVTSPNGTTQEALGVLMDPESGLEPLMTRAVAAATARSKELAG